MRKANSASPQYDKFLNDLQHAEQYIGRLHRHIDRIWAEGSAFENKMEYKSAKRIIQDIYDAIAALYQYLGIKLEYE
jgi:hypothetical protein